MADGAGDRLILADDEPELLDALARALRYAFPDLEVAATTDALEAQRWLEEAPARLLITDIRMPGASGLDLLSTATRRWGFVPTIIMTAFAPPELDEALELGTFHYLPKPFRNHQLIEAVAGVLRAGAEGEPGVSVLPDVVQLHALAHSSGRLEVRGDGGEEGDAVDGVIHFAEGTIVHAATGEAQGVAALAAILGWRRGRFAFEPDAPPSAERTIEAPTFRVLAQVLAAGAPGEGAMTLEPAGGAGGPPPTDGSAEQPSPEAGNIVECLQRLRSVHGFEAACVASQESGQALASLVGEGLELAPLVEAAAAVVRRNEAAAQTYGDQGRIEELIMTSDEFYHVLRPVQRRRELFLYVVLRRERTNLAIARFALSDIESDLVV